MAESTNLTAEEQAELDNPEIEAEDWDVEVYDDDAELLHAETDVPDGFIEDDSGYIEDVEDLDGAAAQQILNDEPVEEPVL